MNPSTPTPLVALCPRCFNPIDLGRTFRVDVCLPVQPPYPPGPPTAVDLNNYRVPTNPPANPSQPPAPEQDDPPASPQQDDAPAPAPSGHSRAQEHEQDRATRGNARRSSASSSSSFDSAFTQFSYNADFFTQLKAIEDEQFSKIPFKPSSSQPPPSSPLLPPSSQPQPTPPSSPSTESSMTLISVPTSSPSTESSLTPSVSGEPPSTGRRWVVFRGRVPGVYTSSTAATGQTDGFPRAFMLAFEDPTTANTAYEEFLLSGTIPTHGHGPWVVFVGRQPGVFTSYEDLCASVVGFSNNLYRCCESVEEGTQALDAFMEKQVAGVSAALPIQIAPGPMHVGHRSDPAMTVDDSWWCCFAGAEPGVYHGLARLMLASPAIGGVRRVNSEEEGWDLWSGYLADNQVCVVPRD